MIILNLPTANFLQEVEEMVILEGMSYMDSIIAWCDKKNIEIESMSSVIANNSVIKAKIQLEAENLNFLPKSIKLSV
jgi:hypothetical protein